MVAAVVIGDEALEPVGGPFHRPAEPARGVQHADVFRIGRRLHAERAADVAGQHPDLFRRHVEDSGKLAAHAERALAADVQNEALGLGVIGRDRRARLHRVDDHAIIDEPEANDVGGARECLRDLVGIAIVIIERDVVRRFLVERRRAGFCRLARPGHRGQRLDLDRDRLGGFACLNRGLGDHERQRIADEAHLVGRQRRPRRLAHLGAVAILECHDAFERAVAGGREILAGERAEHARHGARRRHVDVADHAVPMAAAHHRRIGLAGQPHVVGVAALAAHQLRVLGARHRLADAELLHGPIDRNILIVHDAPSMQRGAGPLGR